MESESLVTVNPFGNSRVDTPFQNHADLKSIYHDEFQILTSVISEIKGDRNCQSRGVAVIGEPGTGKTHLMMRLAREVLSTNRVLFIRQPNNPNFILYHIYSRILESLVENVPGTPYSQLEHLLSKSFSKIIISAIRNKKTLTRKDETILNLLSSDHLNIYKKIGSEGTETKRRNWRYIETKTLEWWSRTYGFGGSSLAIVKGLIRFCSYSDPGKRELVRTWLSANGMDKASLESIGLDSISDTVSKEEFSLEAISVFGKLSIEDEPLIVVFDQLEGMKYNENLLLSFGEAIKEVCTHLPNSLMIFNLFPDRWVEWQSVFDSAVIDRMSQYRVFLNTPEKAILKSILSFRVKGVGLELTELFTKEDIDTIISRPSIRSVLNSASDYFRLRTEGTPLPRRVRSAEEETKEELRKLKSEILAIKRFLNMAGPTFKEMEADEELRSYFSEQKGKLIDGYDKKVVISDSDDAGKLMTIFEAVGDGSGLKTGRIKTGSRKFPEYVMLSGGERPAVFGFLNHDGISFTSRIKNFNLLAESRKDLDFFLLRDIRSPEIKAKVARGEIDKLNGMENGRYLCMDRENRISFELIYSTVTDILNRDLEVETEAAVRNLKLHLGKYWLTDLMVSDQ